TIAGYGFYWFLLSTSEEAPAWHKEWLGREEAPVLVLPGGWSTFARAKESLQHGSLARKALDRLETELIPQFMAAQRWYAGKDATNPDRTTSAAEAASAGEGKAGARAQLLGQAEWTIAPGNSALLALFEV